MKLKWILAIIVVIAVVVATMFVSNIGIASKVNDFVFNDGSGKGAADKNETADQPVYQNPNATDPNNPTDGTTPSKILPVAYGYFKGIKVSIIADVGRNTNNQITGFGQQADSDGLPTVQVFAYNGSADPVYEWAQSKPLTGYQAANVTMEWWVTIEVESMFSSTKYFYPDPNAPSKKTTMFDAIWTSSHITSRFDWPTNDVGDKVANHTWDSTGRIFYWEPGAYMATIKMYCTYTYDNGGYYAATPGLVDNHDGTSTFNGQVEWMGTGGTPLELSFVVKP